MVLMELSANSSQYVCTCFHSIIIRLAQNSNINRMRFDVWRIKQIKELTSFFFFQIVMKASNTSIFFLNWTSCTHGIIKPKHFIFAFFSPSCTLLLSLMCCACVLSWVFLLCDPPIHSWCPLFLQSVTMTSWRPSVPLSRWVGLRWLSWLCLFSSWPSTFCSALEICGSSNGWFCSERCCPGTSASSSSSSCPLMSARYETVA